MKAVISAVGWEPRFLPLTKAIPKEMLPLGKKPVIQYVVAEAVAAGFDEILLILSQGKQSICDYFTPNIALEEHLIETENFDALEAVRHVSNMASIQYLHLDSLLTIGETILRAQDFVAEEPMFVVLHGDTVMRHSSPLPHMVEAWKSFHKASVCLESCLPHLVSHHGIAGGKELEAGIFELNQLLEKPDPEVAPALYSHGGSRLPYHALADRYLFSPEIFPCLHQLASNDDTKCELTHAMELLREKSGMLGVTWFGEKLDVGNPEGLAESNRIFIDFDE